MRNVTITEISGSDVAFDQHIDTDTVIASSGGIAVGGSVGRSAFNTGVNTGVVAGGEVALDRSVLGNGNTQLSDSTVGAFAQGGIATNVAGENVNMGSGDLIDVDAGGDAQVTNGHFNRVAGDTTVGLHGVDGPVNLAVGDGNRQTALEDNSTTVEDSFNHSTDVRGSFNTLLEDSFNTFVEDNDTTSWSWSSHAESHVDIADSWVAARLGLDLDLE
jgi:hypothetical protein